jgi:RibD C-terminal domain
VGKVVADITMTLDGYVAGPNPSLKDPLGVGGEGIHEWLYGLASFKELHSEEGGEQNADSDVVHEPFAATGATVMGRRAGPRSRSSPEGVESAVEQAKAAAGDKDVNVAGGADVIQKALAAGLLEELQIHFAPLLLGGGTRLFGEGDLQRLERMRVIDSPAVTHVKYRVVKA